MELTPEQVAAARAIGCAFFPATELQVQRLTMQQRIFKVEGKHYLLSRDGSYFETAGTLRALIAKAPPAPAPEPPAPAIEAPAAEVLAPEPPLPNPVAEAPAPEPQPGPVAEAALPEPLPVDPAPPPPARRRGRPPKAAAPPAAIESPAPEPAPEPAPPPPPPDAEVAPSRRRTKEAQPRWKTAGLARRGRLKPPP